MDDQCVDSGDGKDDDDEEGFDERLIWKLESQSLEQQSLLTFFSKSCNIKSLGRVISKLDSFLGQNGERKRF